MPYPVIISKYNFEGRHTEYEACDSVVGILTSVSARLLPEPSLVQTPKVKVYTESLLFGIP